MRRSTHQTSRNRLKLPFLTFLLCLLALPSSQLLFLGQEAENPEPPQASKGGQSSIKIEVDLVLVNATVTDPSNRFVTGLEKDHFQLFEDKVEQKLTQFSNEDIATSIGLLFDVSSSMGDKIGRAKDAAIAFLKTSNPDDEFFLLTLFPHQPIAGGRAFRIPRCSRRANGRARTRLLRRLCRFCGCGGFARRSRARCFSDCHY